MRKNTGGPAFPTPPGHWTEEGMTLRDYFAAKAMSAIMPSRPPDKMVAEQIAEAAYFIADAMLKVRREE